MKKHPWIWLLLSFSFLAMAMAHLLVIRGEAGKGYRKYHELSRRRDAVLKKGDIVSFSMKSRTSGGLGAMFGLASGPSPSPPANDVMGTQFILVGVIIGKTNVATLALAREPDRTFNVQTGDIVDNETVNRITAQGVEMVMSDGVTKVFLPLPAE